MKCENCKIRNSTAFIRAKEVCGRCYQIIRRDNLKRFQAGESMPIDFKILKQVVRKATRCLFCRIKFEGQGRLCTDCRRKHGSSRDN